MNTEVIKVDPENPAAELIKKAARILKQGGLVVIPTETVYGIAANMANPSTLERLTRLKQRPKDKPFSIHVAAQEEAEKLAKDIFPAAYRLMESFWPGPLTLVLKSKENTKIGIRIPDHKVALAIISEAAVPVVCPSANISGETPAQTAEEALQELRGEVDLVVDAGKANFGQESTVVDATTLPLVILRQGAIVKEKIEEVAYKKNILFVCTGNSCRSVMAKWLLEKKLKQLGRKDIEVSSAGVMMLDGLGATEQTLEVLRKEEIDASSHRSQRLTPETIKKSDLILTMEKAHEERVLELAPEAKKRMFLLLEFAKIKGNNLDVADPIGKPLEFYERTFQTIKEAIERISQII